MKKYILTNKAPGIWSAQTYFSGTPNFTLKKKEKEITVNYTQLHRMLIITDQILETEVTK